MTIPVDSIAVDNLRMAASQGEHDRVITDSKAMCKHLLNLHLQTLDIQARSYVASAQITEAMDIATTMQQMDPASALGYLCQGYIHTQQGRFLAAARIYDTAFEHVPIDDPFYERLQKDKNMALERSARVMDIVGSLPNDISYRIFELLFTGCGYEEYCQYLLVSSTWRECMFQSGHLQVIIEDEMPFEETNPVMIESFQHIRSIEYLYCSSPFYMLFKSPASFKSLTSLIIDYSTFGEVDQAITTLRSIGNTLTTLVLRDDSYLEQRLDLSDIFKSCPHLVSLDCIMDFRLSPLEENYPALLHLTLHPAMERIDSNVLMDILPRLPSLQELDVSNVPASTPMGVVHASCRSLQQLRYSDSKVTFYRETISSDGHGLRKLDIKNTTYTYSLDDILPLLVSHHDTLEMLFVYLRAGTSGSQSLYDVMKKNDHIRFSNLHSLHVKCMDNPRNDTLYLDMMAWVVQRAPVLKNALLGRYAVYPPLLRAIAQCVCLESVITDSLMSFPPDDRPEDYDHVFAQFIKHHVDFTANRGGSRLKTLHVGMVNIDDMLVQSMGGLKCLRGLELHTYHPIDTSFVPLFQALSDGGAHDLHTLNLQSGFYGLLKISNDVLYLLHAFPNLKNLNTMGDLSESTMGALSLRQCPRLENVVLSLSKLDKDVIQVLNEKIRFVRFG